MAKTLLEYAEWLDERNLRWPAAVPPEPSKATPYLKPFPGIRAVTWGAYGTLLSIADGRLLHVAPEELRMEVALEKTIHEFNMWHSMSRKPGAPWVYMFQQYRGLVEAAQLAASPHRGEPPEVNSAEIWSVLIGRLQQKDYSWDESFYGDIDAYSEKVAFFFHSALQGIGAAPNALLALEHVAGAGCAQSVVGDGQCFTLLQLHRALAAQGPVPPLGRLLTPGSVSLSYQFGVRQPSETLFRACLARFDELGIAPEEVLHVAPTLARELAPAKRLGMRTALFAGDRRSLEATPAEVNDPALRPDRILTDPRQIRQIIRNA